MKKYTLLVATLLIVPSITFASWWNPLSWGIFSFLLPPTPQVQMVSTTTPPTDQTLTENAKISATTSTQKALDGVMSIIEESKASNKDVQQKALNNVMSIIKESNSNNKVIQPPPVQVQTPQPPQPSGTLCNGTYYSACPVNQNFVCPQSGSAYCQALQQPTPQPVQKQDGYQFCSSTYSNSIWDGSSYTSSGGFNCSCKSGYAPSIDSKSCQLLGTPYKAQDGNCYYSNAYDSTGNPLQASCPVQSTQAVSTSDNSECRIATENLKKFQDSYAYGYSSVSQSASADVASARAQIFSNQYNTELPAYQTAAQAACYAQLPITSACASALQKFDAFQKQNPLNPTNTSGSGRTFGDSIALRFPAYQTEIQYACR